MNLSDLVEAYVSIWVICVLMLSAAPVESPASKLYAGLMWLAASKKTVDKLLSIAILLFMPIVFALSFLFMFLVNFFANEETKDE